MELQVWATTDVGKVRDHNEDNFLVDKGLSLFVVCDGMGGHAAGEVASAMSVRAVRDVVAENREVFERLGDDPDDLTNRRRIHDLLEHAILEACARVYRAAQDDPSRRGMGTTCSVLLLARGRGFVGHVGDSRIYLERGGKIHQITEDHSLINEMIRLGKVKRGEEASVPHRNAVTRAVGVNQSVEVDTFELDVLSGDTFLMCSDGLSGYFDGDDDILGLVADDDVRHIAERCVHFANEGGGKDNITAVVVRVARSEVPTDRLQQSLEVLRSTPYFQYLSYKELVQVVNVLRTESVPVGHVLVEEGAPSPAMYLVVEGGFARSHRGRDMGPIGPGDHACETTLIDDAPQPYALVALEDSVVLSLRRDRFVELLRSDAKLAVKLLWNFVQTFALRMRTVPFELFLPGGVEDLRQTEPDLRGDVGAADEAEDLRATVRLQGVSREALDRPWARTAAPQSQVIKRPRLVIGDPAAAGDEPSGATDDERPAPPRKSAVDSTAELDIDDDNVEEMT